jgi:tripartite-type tricarboxylate transporter receptor subunit TctC
MKPPHRRQFLHLAAGAAALQSAPRVARAQTYPSRPVRLIVPQAAGSSTDTTARVLAAELGPRLGQPVVVEDHPGGALTLGLDLTAKSAPDGYTIGVGPIGALAITRHMVPKLPYDIERDFQPIAVISRGQFMLAVSPMLPVTSVKELIEYAKQHPGMVFNASSSNGSPGHVTGELFKSMTGTSIVHVPYKGGSAAINDLIAGHVQLMFEALNSIGPIAKSGQVRGLAVTSATRSPAFPDLPTVAEAGVPGFEAAGWVGLVGPVGMPKAVLDKINSAVNQAVASPSFKNALAITGDEPGGGTPEQFADLIRRDSAKWGEVIRTSGARLD